MKKIVKKLLIFLFFFACMFFSKNCYAVNGNSGFFEKSRTVYNGVNYSSVYNYTYYMKYNPDLRSKFTNKPQGALRHFVLYGMKQKRQAIPSFNVTAYAYANQDLRRAFKNDYEKYYTHYMKYGRKERRTAVNVTEMQDQATVYNGVNYKYVYDINYYMKKYPELKAKYGFDDQQYLMHFAKYGIKEGRQAKSNFDIRSYRYANRDLRKAFRGNLTQYVVHYTRYGRFEGRKKVGVSTLQKPWTVYEGVDYSKEYNFWIYRSEHPELKQKFGMDDYGLLEYYVMHRNGARTMDRLLQTAIKPVGTTMYIWGGGWNEADTGAGVEAVTMGVSEQWAYFADRQNSNYNYRYTRYQIHNGLDCSGYIGWLVYNTLNNENGKTGYVMDATAMARTYASYGWGIYLTSGTFKPGDICSMNGHVWMSLGSCADGSVLLVHSSPPGVRICGTKLSNGADSQAVALARAVMSREYPYWYNRFPSCSVSYSYITSSSRMRWNETTLSDEKGLRNMSAPEIVNYLYKY